MTRYDDKSEAIKQAERSGGETFDPTVDQPSKTKPTKPEPTRDELLSQGKCPDCKGEGIRNPRDILVCSTCEGSGKA